MAVSTSRLKKSTQTDKLKFLSIALENRHAAQLDLLKRQRADAFAQIFREKCRIEDELRRQRAAKLTDPIPKRLQGEGYGPDETSRPTTCQEKSRVRRHGNESFQETVSSDVGIGKIVQGNAPSMRRSVSEGNLLNMSSVERIKNQSADIDTNVADTDTYVSSHDNPSPYKNVIFVGDETNDKEDASQSQRNGGKINPDSGQGTGSSSSGRLLDSMRALNVYRTLQRNVQKSIGQRKQVKHSEAVVDSTLKLMKRRHQRLEREAARSKTTASSKPVPENLAQINQSSAQTARSSGTNASVKLKAISRVRSSWSNASRNNDASPSSNSCGTRFLSTEAYRLPTLSRGESPSENTVFSMQLRSSMEDAAAGSIKHPIDLDQEKRFLLTKMQQTIENRKVMHKIDAFYSKY